MENENYVVKVGKILSRQKKPDRYTLVSILKPQTIEEKNHGIIYFIIEILSTDPSMMRVAKLIEKTTIDEYYQNLSDGLTSLENALKKINERLASLADEGEIGWIGKINAVIAVLEQNILHVTQSGNLEAYLVRNHQITHITENLSSPNEKPNPIKTFINIASGDLIVGDKVIISTSELFYHFSLDDLRRIAAKFSPSIAAAYIVKMLRKEEIESINTLILELGVGEESDNKFSEIGKKIFNEENIVEQYQTKVLPFWRAFLTRSKKGVSQVKDKTKEVYGDRIAPSVSKFAEEASKKVNEKLAQKEMPKIEKEKKGKAAKDLLGLISNEPTKKGKLVTPQQGLFDSPRRNPFVIIISKTTTIIGHVKEKVSGSKKMSQVFGIIAIALIVILTFSGILSYGKKSAANKRTRIEQQYMDLKNKVDGAIKANELGDIKNAQALLEEAKNEIKSISSSKYMQGEIFALEKKIDDSVATIFKIQQVDDATSLTNFNTVDPTIKLGNIFRVGNKVFAIDRERYKGVSYSLDEKKTSSEANLTFDGLIASITLLNDKNSVAMLTNNPDGLYVFNAKVDATQKTKQITDEAWPQGKAVSSYLGNIYILVPKDSQIYKYASLVNNYSAKNNYIKDVGVDISNSIDMAIDGSVYLLQKNGDVVRFTAGKKDVFGLTGIPSDSSVKEKDPNALMINPIRIITTVDMQNIYVADAGAKKIIAFDKDGKYKTQYVSSKWTDMKDIWVAPDLNKVFVLSGTELFEVNTTK
ncbi:MAG TPA: hypothetical protein P5096_03925 [Patescibacteria group bacterium]|nr:hypothetical protein [Patescibacteria group bacterium]